MNGFDPCVEVLLKQAKIDHGQKLWFADESQLAALASLSTLKESITLVSNRFDITSAAETHGLTTNFSDWKLPNEASPFNHCYLRICKEKPLTHYLIGLAQKHLGEGGQLHLCGAKNEGIKSYHKYASGLFAKPAPRLEKKGNTYICSLSKTGDISEKIDLSDYHKLRQICSWKQEQFFSKHGVYGWDKIDTGSALLIEYLEQVLDESGLQPKSLLDLGCGYGFLTIASKHILCERKVATDSNAAALICTKKNVEIATMDVEVVAADCADQVEGKFDLILCNPPFHKGFDHSSDLTDHFLKAAKNKLCKHGLAYFVVNSFIPLEKKALSFFSKKRLVLNNGQFKLYALSN